MRAQTTSLTTSNHNKRTCQWHQWWCQHQQVQLQHQRCLNIVFHHRKRQGDANILVKVDAQQQAARQQTLSLNISNIFEVLQRVQSHLLPCQKQANIRRTIAHQELNHFIKHVRPSQRSSSTTPDAEYLITLNNQEHQYYQRHQQLPTKAFSNKYQHQGPHLHADSISRLKYCVLPQLNNRWRFNINLLARHAQQQQSRDYTISSSRATQHYGTNARGGQVWSSSSRRSNRQHHYQHNNRVFSTSSLVVHQHQRCYSAGVHLLWPCIWWTTTCPATPTRRVFHRSYLWSTTHLYNRSA